MTFQKIYDQMEEVRRTGAVNMMDKNGVQSVANELGYRDLVLWLEEATSKEYVEVLQTFPKEHSLD